MKSSTPPSPEALRCTLSLDASEGSFGSPVLARISLENRGAKEIVLDQPFDDLYGTAVVQLRRPGESSFSFLKLQHTGVKQLEGYRSTLPAGQQIVSYVLVVSDSRGLPVFDADGRYELRASARTSSGEAISAPVTVTVGTPARERRERIQKAAGDLVHLSLNEALDAATMARLRQAVGGQPDFHKALLAAEAVTLINRPDKSSLDRGAVVLQELRQAGSPLWRELATAWLALDRARAGDSDAARRLIDEVPVRSKILDDARQSLPRDTKRRSPS